MEVGKRRNWRHRKESEGKEGKRKGGKRDEKGVGEVEEGRLKIERKKERVEIYGTKGKRKEESWKEYRRKERKRNKGGKRNQKGV